MKFSIKAIMLITAEVALLCALPMVFVFAITVIVAAAASILPVLSYRRSVMNPRSSQTENEEVQDETDSVFTLPLLMTVIAFVVLYFRLRG